jgi:CheY-like chemotaxis protein
MTSHTNLQPIPANESAAPAARSVRILLVDDNQDTLKFLSTILHRQGHQVLTAPYLTAAAWS